MSIRPSGCFAAAVLALLLFGCERRASVAPSAPAADSSAISAPNPQAPDMVLFVGTSLTAGLGLPPEQAYPALVQQKIDSAGLPFRVVNAGVSGETSAGARRRLDWLLRQPFRVLVLETGANDMLRGTDLDSTQANLAAIVARVKAERPGVPIVLAGMMAPPNLGRAYADRFAALYPELAQAQNLPLVPFLLQDVGGVAALNQADGIHPNAEGAKLLARNVWTVLAPVLRETAAR